MMAEMMAAIKALIATPDKRRAAMENRPPSEATT